MKQKLNQDFLFSFDIPHHKNSDNWHFKIWVYRKLKRINARMVQRSLWRSNNMEALVTLAKLIKEEGGRAIIMEERLVFE